MSYYPDRGSEGKGGKAWKEGRKGPEQTTQSHHDGLQNSVAILGTNIIHSFFFYTLKIDNVDCILKFLWGRT